MLPADHKEVIGWNFASIDSKFWRCSNWDNGASSYWMVEIDNPKNKRLAPLGAIGKNYKRISEHGNSDFGFYLRYATVRP